MTRLQQWNIQPGRSCGPVLLVIICSSSSTDRDRLLPKHLGWQPHRLQPSTVVNNMIWSLPSPLYRAARACDKVARLLGCAPGRISPGLCRCTTQSAKGGGFGGSVRRSSFGEGRASASAAKRFAKVTPQEFAARRWIDCFQVDTSPART